MAHYSLTLYITGRSPRAERAIANLERICQERLDDGYDLAIVDVLEDPGVAEEARILATPTLVKESPSPVRRVIGDLSNTEQVLLGLDLRPDTPPEPGTP